MDVRGAIPKFTDRIIEKWHRPPEIKLGTTLALRIVTPWSAIRIPVKEGRFKRVKWLPSAPESMASEIDILITKPIPRVIEWPGSRLKGTSLVGFLSLENRETVWVVYSFVEMPDFSLLPKGTPSFFKEKSEEDLKNLKEGELLSGLIFREEPDGSRTLYDCGVEVQIDEK